MRLDSVENQMDYMISYAQNFEDLILYRIFKHKKVGTYVDVGANDPVEDNMTYHFYRNGWRGVNIEPNTTFFKKLSEQRSFDTNINTGCSDKSEKLDFYEVAGSGLSTFTPEYIDHIKSVDLKIKKQTVHCLPLKDILAENNIKEIDFMSIDVEGFELKVLQGNNWELFRPRVIILEAISPNNQEILTYAEALSYLEKVGYQLRYFDGLNIFVTDKNAEAIAGSCFYPPNLFDKVRKYSDFAREEKLKEELAFALTGSLEFILDRTPAMKLVGLLLKKIRNRIFLRLGIRK